MLCKGMLSPFGLLQRVCVRKDMDEQTLRCRPLIDIICDVELDEKAHLLIAAA